MNKKPWTAPTIVRFGTVEDITLMQVGTAQCKNVPGGVGVPILQPSGVIKNCGLIDAVNHDAGAIGS